MRRLLLITSVTLLALTAAACTESAEPTTAAARDFTVETFDGEQFRLADHRGTPVVLNFWESW